MYPEVTQGVSQLRSRRGGFVAIVAGVISNMKEKVKYEYSDQSSPQTRQRQRQQESKEGAPEEDQEEALRATGEVFVVLRARIANDQRLCR